MARRQLWHHSADHFHTVLVAQQTEDAHKMIQLHRTLYSSQYETVLLSAASLRQNSLHSVKMLHLWCCYKTTFTLNSWLVLWACISAGWGNELTALGTQVHNVGLCEGHKTNIAISKICKQALLQGLFSHQNSPCPSSLPLLCEGEEAPQRMYKSISKKTCGRDL